MLTKRQVIQWGAGVAAVLGLGACGATRESVAKAKWDAMSPEDQALAKRFAVLRGGGQLVVDSLFHALGMNMFDADGGVMFSKASLRFGSKTYVSYRARLGVPKVIRVEWRELREGIRDVDLKAGHGQIYAGGAVAGDYTVPVASRIPEALLEDLRQNRGSFRLKIRLHPKGVLIGWDIEHIDNRWGYTKEEVRRRNIALPIYHTFAGGDFREADIFNGKPVRKGWYIDPQTKERIETDY